MSNAPTVLLLPGNMCDERMWHDLLPAFAGWKTECHVPVERTVLEMARVCLDRYPGPLIPVGFSMGGIVALAIADIAPDRVAGLGLIDTNAGADRPDRAAIRRRQQRDVSAGGLAMVVGDELMPTYFAHENRSNKPLASLVMDMAIKLGPEVFLSQSEALRTRLDYRGVLGQIGAPLLIACGEQDQLCSPDLHRCMAATSRRSELHVVPGAGHMLPLEQPQELRQLLSGWLYNHGRELACETVSGS